jgi:hypothetical protein
MSTTLRTVWKLPIYEPPRRANSGGPRIRISGTICCSARHRGAAGQERRPGREAGRVGSQTYRRLAESAGSLVGSDGGIGPTSWAARHDDGIVDHKYLASVPSSSLREGQRLRVDDHFARRALDIAKRLCFALTNTHIEA